jgi:hypothetical protein
MGGHVIHMERHLLKAHSKEVQDRAKLVGMGSDWSALLDF